ncbi:hypothetical protein PINS_up004575 [Pythium insidiosum]|nr:hypothetical protein PINS_up004575 [Pythium insidiosum]
MKPLEAPFRENEFVVEMRRPETNSNEYPFHADPPRVSVDEFDADDADHDRFSSMYPHGWKTSISDTDEHLVRARNGHIDVLSTYQERDSDLERVVAHQAGLHTNDRVLLDELSPHSRASETVDYITDVGDDSDAVDLTSRSKMTLSELERYRASLAELMAEYNNTHNRSFVQEAGASRGAHNRSFVRESYASGGNRRRQPEREPELPRHLLRRMESNTSRKSTTSRSDNNDDNFEQMLQELYL